MRTIKLGVGGALLLNMQVFEPTFVPAGPDERGADVYTDIEQRPRTPVSLHLHADRSQPARSKPDETR